MGLIHISDDPSVLAAINPWYGNPFRAVARRQSDLLLGRGISRGHRRRALYADLGHFGRKPIQSGLLFFVLPPLLIDCFRPGCAGAFRSTGDREFVLSDGSRCPLFLHWWSCDGRDRDRQPGGNTGLLADRRPCGSVCCRAWRSATLREHAGQIFFCRGRPMLLMGVLFGAAVPELQRTGFACGIAVSTTIVLTASWVLS